MIKMKNIEYFKEQFTRLFKELEIVHGHCKGVEVYHGEELKDTNGNIVRENIVVEIDF